MPRVKPVLKLKAFKINEQQQEMLDVFTEKWGFISESEVFRQALLFYYRKMEPEYLRPTVQQKIKSKEYSHVKKIEDMTDEEYAVSVVRGAIRTGNGKTWVVTFATGNSLNVIELDHCKEYFMNMAPTSLEFHLKKLVDMPLETMMDQQYWKRELWRLYGIGEQPAEYSQAGAEYAITPSSQPSRRASEISMIAGEYANISDRSRIDLGQISDENTVVSRGETSLGTVVSTPEKSLTHEDVADERADEEDFESLV